MLRRLAIDIFENEVSIEVKMDVREKKATRVFELFDTNSDGFVERSDIDVIIDRVSEALGHQVGSSAYARIQGHYSALWQELSKIDADKDGSVSLDEWITVVNNLASNAESHPQAVTQVVARLFDLFDTNLDGRVSEEEFSDWLVANGSHKEEALEAFSELDKNADGYLSRAELNAFVQEFLVSDNLDATGNWLFGPI